MPLTLSPDAARELQVEYNPLVERTRRQCACNPLANAVRLAVTKFERDLHRAGWGVLHKPVVIRMDRHRSQNRVWIEIKQGLTAALHQLIDGQGGHVGRGLREQAELAELVRSGGMLADGTLLPPWPAGDTVEPADPNRLFYGYGLCSEAWRVSCGANRADRKALDALARDHALDTHPERVDARSVHLVCRDDRKWFCSRVRGAAPNTYSWRSHEEDGARPGLIFHALSRMTNAAADDPVSIVPADAPVPD